MSKKRTGGKKSASLDNGTDLTTYDPEPYFALLDMFFERNNQVLVKHHIDSYNQFMEEIIPSILQGGENIISEKISENKVIKYRLTFDDIGPKIPRLDSDDALMYPHDAIQKKLSYSAFYTATITQWQDITDIDTGKKESMIIGTPEKDVPIAKIPIMVRSKFCNLTLKPDMAKKHCKYDTGGYFIVNGSEKVVLSVESIIDRKPMVFAKKDQNTFMYYVQARSRPVTQFVGNVQTFTIKIKKDNSINLDYKQFKEIPIFTLMRALGFETDEDIIRSILDIDKEPAMLNFLNIAFNIPSGTTHLSTMTREDAINFLMNNMRSTKTYSDVDPEVRAQQKRAHLMKILTQFILPHVTSGTKNPEIDMIYKAYYIGYMVHKLLKCYLKDNKDIDDTRGCDDRDAMYNKRIELPGILLGGLFEQFFKKMLNECNKVFRSKNVDQKKPINIVSHIKPNFIEQGLRQALSMGIFGSQSRKGLAQMFSRLNHLHSASYLRRVLTPTVDASTNKMTGPRHLHNTQYNIFCPLESPEGPKTGLVKNLSLLSSITIAMNEQIPIIMGIIADRIILLESVNLKKLHRYVKIIINGNWIGVTGDILKIHNILREKRFIGEIEKTVSFVMNYRTKEFKIYTEGGRLYRPYLTVDPKTNTLNFKPEMLSKAKTWDEFITMFPHVIEYLDVEEQQNMMLATFPMDLDLARNIMSKPPVKSFDDLDRINRTNRYDGNVFDRYTHCEIHPCTMLGTISSNIPFCNHNAGVRGIYGYSQQKQAMGLYISDWRERTDISYILYHTQVPIVTSRASKYTGAHIFPSGENCLVAIMSYTGYNQEDSLLMNNSAIEKGLFRAQVLKKYQEEIKKNPASSQTSVFMKPDRNKVDNLKDANYDKIAAEGYAKAETYIKDGDAIIGMVNPKASAKEDDRPYTDNSTIYKSVVPGAIDRVFTGFSGDGYPIIKMRVRSERIPIVGDKFACYDDKTDIMTDSGWIKFKNLTKKHKVATLVDGEKLVYEHPTKIQSYDYDGDMYLLETNQVNLCVTPNHRMWVAPRSIQGASVKKYRFERADEIIGLRRFYQKNADVFNGNSDTDTNNEPFYVDDDFSIENGYFVLARLGNLPAQEIDMKSWLTFFGIWMAEGFVKDRWALSISAHKQRVKDASTEIIEKYNWKVTRHKNGGPDNQWNIPDKQLVKHFQPLSVGATNKFLPEWIWCLNMEQSRWLIHGMMLGDGHWMGSGHDIGTGTMRYDTSSKQLADDFQRLCLHAGWSTNIALKNEKGYTNYIDERKVVCTVDAWRLTIVTKQNNPKVNKTKKMDKMIEYDGKVYCCTVPSGVIYVRRNKTPIFSGNSIAGQKGWKNAYSMAQKG